MAGRAAWTDPVLRAAWARRDFGKVFKRYRDLTGVSQRGLERLIDLPQSRISDIERGKRGIRGARVIERISQGLQVPEELGGLPARTPELSPWQPPGELRDRIAHAHRVGRADLRVADRIADVLAMHRRTEDVVGGREMWPIVRSQCDAVTRLLPSASGTAADRLLSLAAEHAHWLSWVAHHEGQRGAALAWLDLAAGWAMDAGALDLTSWVTRVRSYYALDRADAPRALRTAEAARHAPRELSPAAASIAAHQEAMAAAAVGERDRARRASDEALQEALRVPEEGERPGWLYWLDPVRARLEHADVAYAVRDWATARDGYAESLQALTGYPRDHAYYAGRMEDAAARV